MMSSPNMRIAATMKFFCVLAMEKENILAMNGIGLKSSVFIEVGDYIGNPVLNRIK